MTQFCNKFKKPCFWPIFPIFGTKKIFLENPTLSRTTSYGFLAPSQNLEKVNDTIQRKHPDRLTEGRKDRQTLFYRILPANARGPIKKVLCCENLFKPLLLIHACVLLILIFISIFIKACKALWPNGQDIFKHIHAV